MKAHLLNNGVVAHIGWPGFRSAALPVIVAVWGCVTAGPAAGEPAPAAGDAANPATNAGPKIQFAEVAFDFHKVESGRIVKHEFVFTNTGTQVLEISAVRPGCGCTTAGAWDKQVEPGKTGTIPIQFNSAGYGGTVLKTIGVVCNDPARTNVMLQLTGTVWRPIDVMPAMVMFTPLPDSVSNETRVVKITNNQEEPLKLSDLQCTNHAFEAKLKTVREGKEFELDVTAVAPFQAGGWTPITLKTSSTNMPVISISCYMNVQPLLAAAPAQIYLPAGPLLNAFASPVSIRNNSANSVTLSEPAVNVEGVELKLQEVQTGRVFNLTATFPAGFTNRAGQQMEMSVKSSHPKVPVLKVPILQVAAPANAAATALKAPAPTITNLPGSASPSIAALRTNAPVSTPAPLTKAPVASATNAAGANGPRIQFVEPIHDFGKVDSGVPVKYEYLFTNTGNAVLEITSVRPACGCTAAGDFDKRVEPGKTGKIPVQFNTSGYGGPATKTITVSCNDPAHGDVLLQLKGTLFVPIELTPAFATFTPGPDVSSNELRVIKIVSNLEEPVTLSDLRCTNRAFQAELKTVREGKEFELRIAAVPPFASAHLWTPIMLKTSSSRMTNLTVNCYLNVQPALAVLPSQITLPAGPLTNAGPYAVTIRNNTTNTISLSDPSINVEGAEVKLQESQPGRQFNLTATFPVGFQSQPGQLMEVSIKSSYPSNPLLKIPIIQLPGPDSAPLPAAAAPAVKPPAQQSSSASPSASAPSSAAGARLPTTLASQKLGGSQ